MNTNDLLPIVETVQTANLIAAAILFYLTCYIAIATVRSGVLRTDSRASIPVALSDLTVLLAAISVGVALAVGPSVLKNTLQMLYPRATPYPLVSLVAYSLWLGVLSWFMAYAVPLRDMLAHRPRGDFLHVLRRDGIDVAWPLIRRVLAMLLVISSVLVYLDHV